ncbi:MAG TPA: polysaccharide deacetylase family protein [Thermodesulfobacteriota bacterium]|nr:polysaccharide deacetylase family protein [Thermodesulfobacteriota bacterium]
MPKSIPILAYHHVSPLVDDMINVSLPHFEDQMALLNRGGFTALFISEAVDCLQGRKTWPSKPVVLTFDDGYRDNFQFAFPLLKKFGIKATIFTVTGWMSEFRDPQNDEEIFTHRQCRELAEQGQAARIALSWEEARLMEESGLVEIESHGHSHNKELFLNGPGLRQELYLSQESFIRHLNRQSRHFCWPGGRFNESSLKIAGGLGFISTCTTERGINIPGHDPMRLKRVTAKDDQAAWLKKTLLIFSSPFLGGLYAKIKPK